MLVKDVMTEDVVTLNAFMSIRDAVEVMARRGISGAPVVDNEGKLIGILTESDILKAIEDAADEVRMVFPSLHTTGVMFELAKGEKEIMEAFEEAGNTVVMDVMSKKVVTCTPDTVLNMVASLLVEHRINRLPVVDKDDRVVGIITRGDIVKALSQNNAQS